MKTADLVLEGGGVKGAGLAGAVMKLAEQYSFHRVAGTSAGAIVASFVAAGLTDRLQQIMVEKPFTDFLDGGILDHLGRFGQGVEVLLHEGIYRGEALHEWIASMLAEAPRPVTTWGDLVVDGATDATPLEQRYRLVVVVSDISRGRMLRLPWDYQQLLGKDPDTQSVADAIRASASIPFFFRPWRLPVAAELADGHQEVVMTDGGMLSNFPIELFDADTDHPTFGVKLSARMSRDQEPWHVADNPLALAEALVATLTSAHDQRYIDLDSVTSRTVFVDSAGIKATDFQITEIQKNDLFNTGRNAAEQFLAAWNFDTWKASYGPKT